MLPLGTQAPSFSLPDTLSGDTISLDQFRGKPLVVMFICNHCPYVIHIQDKLVELVKKYQKKDVNFVAISSNDVTNYPQDAPEKMKERAQQLDFTFPYLYDESQEVAKAYMAACTPDFYVFNNQLACVYRGRMDGSTPGNNVPVTGADLSTALDQLLAGETVFADQLPSMGCNIKWKN